MKSLYLVRHAEQNINGTYWADANLTTWGLEQAARTGKRVKQLGCRKIASSDLNRASQTSEVINRYLNTRVDYFPELREINYGVWEGLSFSYVSENYANLIAEMNKRELDIPYPGGESGQDVYRRAQKVIEALLHEDAFQSIAIVSHGELILTILCGILNIGFEKRLDVAWLDHCGITRIDCDPALDKKHICYINEISHLEEH